MGKTRAPYPLEFKRQMVELVRAGRTPKELSREFEPTAQSIINWVSQYERDIGERRDGGLTTPESEELKRLRRENRQLKMERDILSKALGPSSQGRPARSRTDLRVREGSPGSVPSRGSVSRAPSLSQWLLRLVEAPAIGQSSA